MSFSSRCTFYLLLERTFSGEFSEGKGSYRGKVAATASCVPGNFPAANGEAGHVKKAWLGWGNIGAVNINNGGLARVVRVSDTDGDVSGVREHEEGRKDGMKEEKKDFKVNNGPTWLPGTVRWWWCRGGGRVREQVKKRTVNEKRKKEGR